MTGSTARPDLAAYDESIRLPVEELVSRLRETLGSKLVAYIGGLRETRTVGAWARGDEVPAADVQERLRAAYRATALLVERDGPGVAQAWFQGENEQMGDRAPARLLRDGRLSEVEPALMEAARTFSST